MIGRIAEKFPLALQEKAGLVNNLIQVEDMVLQARRDRGRTAWYMLRMWLRVVIYPAISICFYCRCLITCYNIDYVHYIVKRLVEMLMGGFTIEWNGFLTKIKWKFNRVFNAGKIWFYPFESG